MLSYLNEKKSVVVFGHKRAALAHQEVEVAAFVGLKHGVDIEFPVTRL
jgi:hypothetical protein